jgi:hypothetical protein
VVAAAVGTVAPKQILPALEGADVIVEFRPRAEHATGIAVVVAVLADDAAPRAGGSTIQAWLTAQIFFVADTLM